MVAILDIHIERVLQFSDLLYSRNVLSDGHAVLKLQRPGHVSERNHSSSAARAGADHDGVKRADHVLEPLHGFLGGFAERSEDGQCRNAQSYAEYHKERTHTAASKGAQSERSFGNEFHRPAPGNERWTPLGRRTSEHTCPSLSVISRPA